MVKAADRAHEIGAAAIQIFSDNPTAWRRRSAPPKEQPRFRDLLTTYDIAPVAIHASYLVNLAGPDEVFFGRSVGLLASELRTAPGFLGRFVNVHIGSHRGAGVDGAGSSGWLTASDWPSPRSTSGSRRRSSCSRTRRAAGADSA